MSDQLFLNHAHVFPEDIYPQGALPELVKVVDRCQIDRVVCFARIPIPLHSSAIKEQPWLAKVAEMDCTGWLAEALKRGGFDILGHPFEMFRKFGLLKAGQFSGCDDPRLQEAGWRVAKSAAKHGMVIEMNNYTVDLPGYEAFVATCYQEGALFSLGSDAHSLDKVRMINDAFAILQRLEVTADRMVDPEVLRRKCNRKPCR